MIERTITQIFPKSVIKSSHPDAEWHNDNILEKISKLEMVKNTGNKTSKDNYVLNNSKFKTLRKAVQTELDLLMSKFYEQEKANLYITQSWFNVSEDDEFHHLHCHTNSIISGTMYLQTVEDDAILFTDQDLSMLRINILPTAKCPEVRLPVTKGDIVLFDSMVFHSVPKAKRKTKRISLSFNTFFTGEIGNKRELTELRL